MRKVTGECLSFNIGLLRRFCEPVSVYDLFKSSDGQCYSAFFKAVRKLLDLGLITLAYSEGSSRNGIKKFWVLSSKGKVLLELFPEDEVEEAI
jgi:hypothetical protein